MRQVGAPQGQARAPGAGASRRSSPGGQDQLLACASEELGRQCHDAGVTQDTSEDDLLATLKQCSIRAQNKLVNVVEFLDISQEPEPASQHPSSLHE